jgi:hypothetical protein
VSRKRWGWNKDTVGTVGEASAKLQSRPLVFSEIQQTTRGHRSAKKCSLFNVQLSSVIFGGAFGAASLTKHCAKRHHFIDGCALSRLHSQPLIRWHMNIEH